jgi:hypothetical protein
VYLGEPEIKRRELPTVRSSLAAPMRGGSGWRQCRRRGGRGWTGSGQGARGGGKEAVGRGNLDGGERSRQNSGEKGAAAARCLVVARKRERQSGQEGSPVGFYSSALPQRREGEGAVMGGAQDGGQRRRA